MADKSVNIGGTNLFSLGANFHSKNSSSIHGRDPSNINDASGNVECETMINNRTDYSDSYDYCNATPDIKTDLGAVLTAFGTVLDSKQPTGLVINFNEGAYASVDITGHNHDNNAHASTTQGVADVSGAVPASAGFGVPDFGLTLGTDATPISASITIGLNHVDANDANGEHWVGKNITYRADLTMELLGLPTSQTVAAIESDLTGWTVDTNGPSDSNSEFDKFAITAHRFFDLT